MGLGHIQEAMMQATTVQTHGMSTLEQEGVNSSLRGHTGVSSGALKIEV